MHGIAPLYCCSRCCYGRQKWNLDKPLMRAKGLHLDRVKHIMQRLNEGFFLGENEEGMRPASRSVRESEYSI